MGKLGKPQKSKKHKKLKPIASEYLDLWNDKRGKNASSRTDTFASGARHGMFQKINSKPSKPNEQEMPRKLQELMRSKEMAKEKKKRTKKKKNRDLLVDDFPRNESMERGMTRPNDETPQFVRYKYDTDDDFLRRVESMTSQYVDRIRFEVANEIIKPGDDPAFKNDPADVSSAKARPSKSQKDESASNEISPAADAETHNSQLDMVKKREKRKQKAASKKNATGFERFKDQVKFGEVAMEPPSLSAKPRGTSSEKKKKVPDLLLLQKLTRAPSGGAAGKLDLTAKRRDLPAATRRKLDSERDRVVEMYREMKKRKIETQDR